MLVNQFAEEKVQLAQEAYNMLSIYLQDAEKVGRPDDSGQQGAGSMAGCSSAAVGGPAARAAPARHSRSAVVRPPAPPPAPPCPARLAPRPADAQGLRAGGGVLPAPPGGRHGCIQPV